MTKVFVEQPLWLRPGLLNIYYKVQPAEQANFQLLQRHISVMCYCR